MNLFFNKLKINHIYCVFFALFFLKCIPSFSIATISASLKGDSLAIDTLNVKGREAQKLGDFEQALYYYNSSFALSRKIFGDGNLRLFLPLVNKGIAFKDLGEYNKALESYKEAEILVKRLFGEEDPRLGFVYSNTGTIYKIQGDYLKYHNFQQAALRCFLKDSAIYKSRIDIVRMNIAESLFLLKKHDEAIRSCRRNLSKVDDEIKSYYTSLLARIYEEKGDHGLADQYYRETFRLLKKVYGSDSYELGLEYNNYVYFLLAANRLEQVPEYNKLAAAIILRYFTEKSTQFSDVMLNQADYFFSRSTEASRIDDFNKKRRADLTEALRHYQKAIIAATTSFSDVNHFSNPQAGQAVSEIHLLQVMKKKSRCLQVLADLNLADQRKKEALTGYQAALDAMSLSVNLIHLIRTGYVSEDSRLILSESEESVFNDAVNICYQLYRQTNDLKYAYKAFEYTERGKAASFLAAVTDSRAREFGNIPDSLVTRENVLKLNISNYRQMLFEENQQEDPDSARLALYEEKLFQYSEKHAQLVKHLEEYFPDYFAFKYKNEITDVASVMNRLNGREALVEYLMEDPDREGKTGKLFRFVITADAFHFSKTAIDPGFVDDIGSVYRFLTNTGYLYTGLEEYKRYVLPAFRLHQQLLGDVRDLLKGKRVIVVPDDQLSYIPFDALLSSAPDTLSMNFRDLPYLVRDYPISYTYSATLLYSYFSKKKEAGKGLLAFAPGYLSDDRDDSQISQARGGLLPLPFASKEVEYANQFISGDVFAGKIAQESRFKEMAGNYDILHLAMHTILNDSLPMYSGLAFSKPLSGSYDDGWLNTAEVYNMKLKARMAVLSACNTGTGKLQKGEGVMSLARGFLYAGCPSIIMTLWEVDDESGSLIMKNFYRLLSGGKSKDEALQLAKLEHIANADPLKAHPHYWLAYVAVGNAQPLFMGRDIYFVLIVIGLVLLFTADQLYRKKKRKFAGYTD